MPKKTDDEVRKDIAKATEILQEVSGRHMVDIPSMRRTDVRYHHFVRARREFCVLAYAAGLGSVTIAKMLECTAGNVRYHLNPGLRAHKRDYYRAKREGRSPCLRQPCRWNPTPSSEPSTITS